MLSNSYSFLSVPLKTKLIKFIAFLRAINIGSFHAKDREIYWLCQKKQSESTFSNTMFERKLKVKTTFPGINTIKKLAVKYPCC